MRGVGGADAVGVEGGGVGGGRSGERYGGSEDGVGGGEGCDGAGVRVEPWVRVEVEVVGEEVFVPVVL